MEPDRVTQAFLSRFSEPIIQEAERLRREGSVKQIFGGPAFIRARVEESGDVYRVILTRTTLGWEWELSGPESQHPAVIAAVMLVIVWRRLPDSRPGPPDPAEALETDLAPFRSLNDSLIGMTAHVRYTAWDDENPATLSATVIRDVIRGRIGFDGLLKQIESQTAANRKGC